MELVRQMLSGRSTNHLGWESLPSIVNTSKEAGKMSLEVAVITRPSSPRETTPRETMTRPPSLQQYFTAR